MLTETNKGWIREWKEAVQKGLKAGLEAGLSDELEVLQSCIRGCSGGLFLPNSLAFPKNTRKMRK